MKVEEQARIARAAIEDAVDPVDPGHFVPRRQIAPVVVALIAVVALAGGVLAATTLVIDTDGENVLEAADGSPAVGDVVAAAPAPATGVWVIDPPPENVEPFIPPSPGDDRTVTFDIYGRADADNPFVDGAVVVGRGTGLVPDDVEIDGEPIDIEGTTAYAGGNAVEWYEGDGVAYVIMSDTLERAALVDVARGVITTGEAEVVGLDLIAPAVSAAMFNPPFRLVLYDDPDDDDPFGLVVGPGRAERDIELFTAALAGAEMEETAAEAWAAVERETRSVDGLGELDLARSDESVTVTGLVDGAPVSLIFSPSAMSVSDADVDEAIALFATIRPATEDEEAAMRANGEAIFGDPLDSVEEP